jgi:U3 small nucleolar RNA-associated protein 12
MYTGFCFSSRHVRQVWDLDTQHCVQTCVGHRSEVWAMDVSPDETRVVTGASDAQLRVWRIADAPGAALAAATAAADSAAVPKKKRRGVAVEVEGAETTTVVAVPEVSSVQNDEELLELLGSVPSLRRERCGTIRYSRDGQFVGVQCAGKGMEVFRVRSADEVKRRIARRKRRQREKTRERAEKAGGAAADDATALATAGGDDDAPLPQDELELWGYITAETRMRSFVFLSTSTTAGEEDAGSGVARLFVSMTDNQVIEYKLTQGEAEVGHSVPTIVKSVAMEVGAPVVLSCAM